MKTLVTGATGHVGALLVRRLLEQERAVRVLMFEPNARFEQLEVEQVVGDVLDPDSLREACADIDVVFHLAAYISVDPRMSDRVHAVNVEGTSHVVEASLQAGVRRFIHMSSIHALDSQPLHEPIDESRALALAASHPPYDRSKALAELKVQEAVQRGLSAVTLNPVGIVGPGDTRPSDMGSYLLSLARATPPAVVGAGFHWVDVRDVVEATLAAEARGRVGERYILSGHYASFRELATLIATEVGHARIPSECPMWLARLASPFAELAARVRGRQPLFTRQTLKILRCHQHIASDRAQRELGFEARPLQESIRDSLKTFAELGWLKLPMKV